VEVVSYPPIRNEQVRNYAGLFLSGEAQGISAPSPETPGRSIALVAINNNEVQQPPNPLDRMCASREKQIAFNK
jgi:hypothetical protein